MSPEISRMNGRMIGAIEAGGTKMVVSAGTGPGDLADPISIPTTTPDETLPRILEALQSFGLENLSALGIASFGPVDLNTSSETYGYITTTPKPGWAVCDLVGFFSRETGLPVGFDTDVNGAAFSELRWGAGKGVDSLLYMTIGTGIGGGFVADGQAIHGLVHQEMGHLLVKRHPADEGFDGVCPFHGDCIEGLAAGPSIKARLGINGRDVDASHDVWERIAFYLAQVVSNAVLSLSPEKIVLGGGVMHQEQLFPMIRKLVLENLNGYVQHAVISEPEIDNYILPPGLGDRAGVLGAIALGQMAVDR